jgi:hypothetical protein
LEREKLDFVRIYEKIEEDKTEFERFGKIKKRIEREIDEY